VVLTQLIVGANMIFAASEAYPNALDRSTPMLTGDSRETAIVTSFETPQTIRAE